MSVSIDPKFVQQGIRLPRAALVEQGLVSEGLAKEFFSSLVKFGWSDAQAKLLRADLDLLQTAEATQADQRSESGAAHAGELSAKVQAKAFIRKLRLAWPLALHDVGAKATVSAHDIDGGTLGESTPRIVAYLTTVAPAIEALDTALTPYLAGVSPKATVVQVRKALEGADTTQELELAQIPESTQRIYEAKGRLAHTLHRLNAIGKIAFDGDAVTRARFNKDILLRAMASAPQPPTA